jgi:hypothetical protein
LKAQETRDEDVRGLAEVMADMLAILEVDGVHSLEKIKPLQATVTAMMKKIEECADFITEYVGHGFLSMPSFTFLTVHKNFNVGQSE